MSLIKLTRSAVSSPHVLRNACEALAHHGSKDKLKEFSAGFKAADDKEAYLRQWFEIVEPAQKEQAPEGKTLMSVMIFLSELYTFYSRNGCHRASKADLRAWIESGHVWINGEKSPDPLEIIDYPVVSMVLFKGARTQLTIR